MTVILNCSSGTAKGDTSLRSRVDAALQKQGVRADIWCAESGKELTELAERAVRSDDETIVAGGGDGSISAVASRLVDTPKRLGVLPLGTLNHFAKDLRMPLDLELAARAIVVGREMRVDVGEINGRTFLNNSSIGLYPHIVQHREAQQERLGRGKWPAFAWAVLSALNIYPTMRLKLWANDHETTVRTPFLFVGNNAYRMDILCIGAREHLDEGILSVYYVRRTGRLGLIGLMLRSFAGRVEQAKNFETLAVRELRVQTPEKSVQVSADGEVSCFSSPLVYKIHPKALRVIVPPDKT